MTNFDPNSRLSRRPSRQGGRTTRLDRSSPHHSAPSASNTSAIEDMLQRVRVALSTVPIHGLTLSSNEPGVVAIDGAVRTDEAYRRAQQLAAQGPGVRRVINRLIVDPLVGSMPVRRTVTEPELAAEIDLNHQHFATSTEERLNDMVGTVDTAVAADEAEPYFPPTDPVVRRAPREQGGFTVVGGFSPTSLDAPIDLEQLPRPLTSGDDQIAREVRLALKEDAATSDLPIHVAVREGVVTLRGIVPTMADTDLAEEVASRVPGVVEVREELEVVGV